MNKLLARLFKFSDQQKAEITSKIETYITAIKAQGGGIKYRHEEGLDIGNVNVPLLKISNRYVFCKKCLVKHLTAYLGHQVYADEITELSLHDRYTNKEYGKYIAYMVPNSNIIFLAKKKSFGIFVEYKERGESFNNFFWHS